MATDVQTISNDNSTAFYEAKMGGDPFVEAEEKAGEVESEAYIQARENEMLGVYA